MAGEPSFIEEYLHACTNFLTSFKSPSYNSNHFPNMLTACNHMLAFPFPGYYGAWMKTPEPFIARGRYASQKRLALCAGPDGRTEIGYYVDWDDVAHGGVIEATRRKQTLFVRRRDNGEVVGYCYPV